jgi:beta-glucosidase
MSAYNRVNGESASASQRLLIDILRRDWGFDGYVVSDCGAIDDIYKFHKIVDTPERAAALGVTRGCDLECGNTYRALKGALAQGLIAEKHIDVALRRLMRARFKLGMFDPPDRVRYAQIPYRVNESPEHDRLARRMADESIVLMKNDGVLPLASSVRTIAVVGPNANELMALLGNYYGTPSKPVTPLAGIQTAAARQGAKVIYARGADLIEGRQDPGAIAPIDAEYLRPAAGSTEHGLKGEYFRGREPAGDAMLTRVDRTIEFRWYRGSPTSNLVARGEVSAGRSIDSDDFSVRWTGQLLPPVSGDYTLSVTGDDGFRLAVDGKRIIDEWTASPRARAKAATVRLEAGKAYDVRLEYFESIRDAEVRLTWQLPGAKPPAEEALAAAKAADVVVFVGGLTADVEGEEMQVSYPGFAGGDRTDIALPSSQDALLRRLHATGKPVVLVLMAGSSLGIEWATMNLPAIVVAWYPGQQGGTAIADVLFGTVNPAGRLPVTFYRSADDLPPFADYGMKGRTYRYFEGQPLYPFGHGLSYTKFDYSDLTVDKAKVRAADAVTIDVAVQNSGRRQGDEVVQLYVRQLHPARPMPIRSLRGFERVPLDAGQKRRVRFTLRPATDFAYYDETTKGFAVDAAEYEIGVGASSGDIRAVTRVRVEQ